MNNSEQPTTPAEEEPFRKKSPIVRVIRDGVRQLRTLKLKLKLRNKLTLGNNVLFGP